MSRTKNEAVLLRTSAATDVICSGGYIAIAGLTPTWKKLVSSIKQVKYRAEVVQVISVGTVDTAWTPVGSTTYGVLIGDVTRQVAGAQAQLKRYTYTTTASLAVEGASAALRREYINAKIVTAINADPTNYVLAASLGSGNGFTITDDAGYYPVYQQGGTNRNGASTVQIWENTDGSGYALNNITTTTAAVYAQGVGADLALTKPVMDFMYGNLISGDLIFPALTAAGLPAISGQKYDAFVITSYNLVAAHNQTGQLALLPKTQVIWVDNGTGSDTANASGFATFENAMFNTLVQVYSSDPSAITFMNNNAPTCGGLNTGLPSGVSLAENVINFGNGNATHYYPLGAATLVALAADTNGIGVVLDPTTGKGVELSAPTFTNSQKSFVVGKSTASVYAKIYLDDASGVNPMLVGFRKKAAANATYTSYTDYAFVGIIGTANPNTIYTSTEINSAGNTNVDTTQTWADGVTKTLEVRVDIAGAVTFYIDGYKPTVTQAITFDAGDEMIPVFCYALQSADIGTPSISQGIFVQDNKWRS